MDVRGGDEVAAVARRLADDVLAEGQAVAGGRREALGIGGDGLDDLTLGVGDAIHHHVVVAVVDDGEGDALEAGTALRLGAGLGVELLHRHAAALDLLGNLRGVVRALGGRVAGGLDLLHGHEVGIEVVAVWCLGLTDHERAARKHADAVHFIKRVARDKITVLQTDCAILIRSKHPSAGWCAGRLGLLLGVVESVVVAHGELGTLKGRGALRQVVGVV